jgi:hypothetical protein
MKMGEKTRKNCAFNAAVTVKKIIPPIPNPTIIKLIKFITTP